VDERLPWPARTAAAALGLITVVWLVGFVLLWQASSLGWLAVGLGTWLTIGLVYAAWRAPSGEAS